MDRKLLTAMALSLLITPVAHATQPADKLEACVKAALAAHPGKAVALRYEIEEGRHQYEIDIMGKDGKFWEDECDAKTGKIVETEREVAGDDAEFVGKAKVRLDAAMKTALDKHPGNVTKIEYEIEEGGKVVAYEFDIRTAGGKLIEVDVDAVTGKLGEAEEVLYQIGE